ncbi:MAG TPA: cytochrome c-type biogenesis protein CcmH [Candidatus Dormibacteraeota bacterium]|nr:cytochrome c-type biogenesis protein CcmH [Candidatus Dormibacteraeota bacterium]
MVPSAGPMAAAAELRSLFLRRSAYLAFGLLLGLLMIFAAAPAASALTPQQAERAHSLSLKLKCMCGGCDDTAGTCNHSGGAFAGPCATARAELKEIDQRISRGESDDLILQDFVQEYGPSVLVSPPAKGFDWLVWVMPVLLPLLAFALVWALVRRWRHRATLQPVAADGPPVSDELIARARREAEKESDE